MKAKDKRKIQKPENEKKIKTNTGKEACKKILEN
jgi:hypothetical protein